MHLHDSRIFYVHNQRNHYFHSRCYQCQSYSHRITGLAELYSLSLFDSMISPTNMRIYDLMDMNQLK